MTEQDFENNAMNLAAEAFPHDFRNQEQRDGDRLRDFLVRQLTAFQPEPAKNIFDE